MRFIEGYAKRFCIYARYTSEKFPKGKLFWYALPNWGSYETPEKDGKFITCFYDTFSSFYAGAAKFVSEENASKCLNKLTKENFEILWKTRDTDGYGMEHHGIKEEEFGIPHFEEYGIYEIGIMKGARGGVKFVNKIPYGMTPPFENEKYEESDNTYKAKVSGKGYLKGNGFTEKKEDADTFESKTEPTQRINQMKKDDRLNKNAKVTVITEGKEQFFDKLLEE